MAAQNFRDGFVDRVRFPSSVAGDVAQECTEPSGESHGRAA
jgi:hypothetical protein